jgi:D-3-phosphoglycerate dehydrogenase
VTIILNLEPDGYSPDAYKIISSLGSVIHGPLGRPSLLNDINKVNILIVRLGHRIDQELLDKAPNLHTIVSATTGRDHIDTAYAEQRGIAVLSLFGETDFLNSVTATAELSWGLLLSLVRQIPAAVQHVKDGNWHRDHFRGSELSGLRLGIIGLGRLGRMVAAYGHTFQMIVSAYDPLLTEWPENIEQHTELTEIFKKSDVISVHAPLNELTSGMIDAPLFKRLPEGAIFINTSRGELVKEDDLLEALQDGPLAGAALDVIRGENAATGKSIKSPLIDYSRSHSNLIITPHIGGATKTSMEKTEVFMAQKLRAHLNSNTQQSSPQ